MVTGTHTDAATRTVRFLFYFEVVAMNLVTNFEGAVAHGASEMLSYVPRLTGG